MNSGNLTTRSPDVHPLRPTVVITPVWLGSYEYNANLTAWSQERQPTSFIKTENSADVAVEGVAVPNDLGFEGTLGKLGSSMFLLLPFQAIPQLFLVLQTSCVQVLGKL